MCDAFVLYQCERFDIRGKAHLRSNSKYYIVDTGIRNKLIGSDQSNREQNAFNGLPEAFPKIMISMDDFDLSEQGIGKIVVLCLVN